jgi:hypothetical protein
MAEAMVLAVMKIDWLCKILFHVGLAALFTHELDAIQQREWRLLYVLRQLPDGAAAFWFIALHPPLFAAISYFAFHRRSGLQQYSRRVLCIFFLLHAGLHWRLMGDQLAPFASALSLTLIHVCGLMGGLYLVLEMLDWRLRKAQETGTFTNATRGPAK